MLRKKKKAEAKVKHAHRYYSTPSVKRIEKIKPPKLNIPRTSQQLVETFFREIDEATDLIRISENEYSICFEYSDITFAKANKEEQESIFLKWVEFLHSFTELTHIQVVNGSTSSKTNAYRKKYILDTNNLTGNQLIIGKELNSLIDKTIGDAEYITENKRYIVLSQKAKNFTEARDIFLSLMLKTEETFKGLKSSIRTVTIQERLSFIYDTINIDSTQDHDYGNLLSYIKDHDCSIYDLLAPPKPNKIDLSDSHYISVGGDKYLRVLYVNKLPKSISPRLYNKITTLEGINLITTLNITPTNNSKIINTVDKKISGMKTERLTKVKRASKNGYSYDDVKDEKLEEKIKNAKQLRIDLTRNDQKVFMNNMLICITAMSYEDLEKYTQKIVETASECLVEVKPMLWQQLEGVQHCLPLGHNTIQFQRSLSSEATAINVPFNSKDIMQPNSLYFGMNLVSKNGIFCDRKKLLNGNGSVLATSGAGKSFAIKLQIEQIFLRYPEDDIIIIDPQKEYEPVVRDFNGQTISISNTSKTHINPLDLSLNYGLSETGKTNPIKSKTEYMIAWVESIIGESGMKAEYKTIIDRCTKRILEPFESSDYGNEDLIPTLIDFYEEIKRQPEGEASKLALILERYAIGAMDTFAKKTNVDIHNRFVNFDISDLTASMQNTGYLVVLDHIMNRLAKNKKEGRYTWLFIDEFHILLNNVYSADYIAKIYKLGRKLGAMNTIITQNISDVLASAQGCKILSNSEFALILKQNTLDVPPICNIFNISDKESQYVIDASEGQGLVVYGSHCLPFRNIVPKDYHLYALNETSTISQSR